MNNLQQEHRLLDIDDRWNWSGGVVSVCQPLVKELVDSGYQITYRFEVRAECTPDHVIEVTDAT